MSSSDSEEDLLKALKTLPLESTLAVLSAWDLYETELANSGENQNGSRKISLPIEADGHHSISADATESSVEGKAERVAWRYVDRSNLIRYQISKRGLISCGIRGLETKVRQEPYGRNCTCLD